jgi:glycosyltransferase involved in cell wall biosynthesis
MGHALHNKPSKTSGIIQGLRIVMMCDDTQIDRRIIHEAESLIRQGNEVIVLGRMAEGYELSQYDGLVKIERVEYSSVITPRRLREAVTKEMAQYQAQQNAQQWQHAASVIEQQFSSTFYGPNYGPPRLEQWVLSRGWLIRNMFKALLWPPMRLDALRRYFPQMPVVLQWLIYAPTLLLTPRPLAIRWHFSRLRQHLSRWFPSWYGTQSKRALAMAENKRLAALERQIIRFEDMNLWELSLYDRACFLRPDVVHVHDLPQLRPAYHVGQTLGVPVIYDAHELYPGIITLTPEQQERLRVTENYYIRRVARAITVNPLFAHSQAEAYNIQTPEVILNAIDLPPEFERGIRTRHLREALRLPEAAKTILFQGWVSFHRNIHTLIEAMVEVPTHIHLVILGYGDDMPAMKKLVHDLGLGGRVHFPSPVPQRELLWWVASADAGIVPYQAVDENGLKCSPNKLFEFIAAGVPIIASKLRYIDSVVGKYQFGVVYPMEKPEDYAQAIREMFLSRDGDENRFRKNLLNDAEPYLWPAQEKTLLRIYRDVLAAWKKPAVSESPAEVLPFTTDEKSKTLSSDTPLRVFHGPYNTAGIPTIMARAERALGLDSKAVCFPSGFFQFQPDIVLEPTTNPADILARFRTYADAFDVFVFHFGTSLANDSLADVPLLKQMGKKVIFYFHGCDIRQSKETIRKYEFSACKECWPQRCSRNRDTALDMAMRYADAVWVSTPDLLEFVPGAELFLQPLDIASLPLLNPAPEAFPKMLRILHAPSDAQLKGTKYLQEATDALVREGFQVTLDLVHGVPYHEVLEHARQANLCMDQILQGAYGKFAAEMMASGVPVMGYLREDTLGSYEELPPLIQVRPDTIYAKMKQILQGEIDLRDTAIRSRAFALQHHSAESAAKRANAVYQAVVASERKYG